MTWNPDPEAKMFTQSTNSKGRALESWLQNYDTGNASKGPVGMTPSLNSAFARPTYTPTTPVFTTKVSRKSNNSSPSSSKKPPTITTALRFPKLPALEKSVYTPLSDTSPVSDTNTNSPIEELRSSKVPSPIGTLSGTLSPIVSPKGGTWSYPQTPSSSPLTSSSTPSTTTLSLYAPSTPSTPISPQASQWQSILSSPTYNAVAHCTKDELNTAFFRLCTELNWDFFHDNLSSLLIPRADWEITVKFYRFFLIGLVTDVPDYVFNILSQDAARVRALVGEQFDIRGEHLYSEMVHTAMSWFAPVKLEGGDWSDIDKAIMEVFFDVLLSGGDIKMFPSTRAQILDLTYPKDTGNLYDRIAGLQDAFEQGNDL